MGQLDVRATAPGGFQALLGVPAISLVALVRGAPSSPRAGQWSC